MFVLIEIGGDKQLSNSFNFFLDYYLKKKKKKFPFDDISNLATSDDTSTVQLDT